MLKAEMYEETKKLFKKRLESFLLPRILLNGHKTYSS